MKLTACRPAPARFTPAPTLQRRTSSLKSPVQFLCYSPRFPSPLAPASALFSLHSNALALVLTPAETAVTV